MFRWYQHGVDEVDGGYNRIDECEGELKGMTRICVDRLMACRD